MIANRTLIAAACFGGAHGAGPAIKTLLTTGSHYLIVHAVLALICAVWPVGNKRVTLAGWLALAGGLVFGLSLAAIGWTGVAALGMITPLGGTMMISAWLLLAFAAFGKASASS